MGSLSPVYMPRSMKPEHVTMFVAQDGSTCATNTARKTPHQRHQLDHTIHRTKLRSVDFTAAAKDRSSLRSVDASEAC